MANFKNEHKPKLTQNREKKMHEAIFRMYVRNTIILAAINRVFANKIS